MTLAQYVRYCQQIALMTYGISYADTNDWSEAAFEQDWKDGLPPSAAVNIRVAETAQAR